LTLNPYSWHHVANVLYVDQPVGTGLSFVADNTTYARSQADVNAMFAVFLQRWFKLFPEYLTRKVESPRLLLYIFTSEARQSCL